MASQKIATFLWFDHQAEEAAKFYSSLFPDSRIINIVPGPTGAALVVEFSLAGVVYLAMNGGPHFKFNEAISLAVNCEDQAEVDRLWSQLTDGGSPGRCGWLKDRYGLSWQIVPVLMPRLMKDPDPVKVGRMMAAMMTMTKLDSNVLQAAFDGQ